MRTTAKRWLTTLALAAFSVVLGQFVAADGFRGRPGGGMAFHPGFGGHGMTIHSVPAGRGMMGHGRSWTGHTARSFPARRSGDRLFRGASSMRFTGDAVPRHSLWAHGGRVYAGWYHVPWYWSPWAFGIGWDPYWWPGYWGPAVGYGYYDGSGAGAIKLKTDQKTAQVFIDGAYAGTVGELKSIRLRPGAYDLEIQTADGRVFQDHVYVLSGKTLKITPTFRPAGAPARPEGS